MRVTIAALGFEMDLTFGPATAAEDAGPADLGATGGTFLSFTAGHEMPDEAVIHRPVSPFEDDSEV